MIFSYQVYEEARFACCWELILHFLRHQNVFNSVEFKSAICLFVIVPYCPIVLVHDNAGTTPSEMHIKN